MSFVDHYLSYFRQWLIPSPPLALLPFQSLFTESSHVDQLLAFPHFSVALRPPCPLCWVFLFSPLFIIQFFFFFAGQGSACPGGYAGLSQGWLWENHMPLICSPKQVWSRCLVVREPSCFLSVTWLGEALCGLGVQGVGVFFLVVFLPSVAPASQQNFLFTELMLSVSAF
jgi:hypothetical protein